MMIFNASDFLKGCTEERRGKQHGAGKEAKHVWSQLVFLLSIAAYFLSN